MIKIGLIGLWLLMISSTVWAKDPTSMQIFYTMKKVLPGYSEVAVFISKELFTANEKSIQRGAMAAQLKPTVYMIENPVDIGENMKKLSDNSLLLLYNTDVIQTNSSKLYILKNAKQKNIAITTLSADYSASGAFLYLAVNAEGKLDIVINLKVSENLADKITPELQQELGIKEIIR
ncbi:MAG: hypothetical protein KBA26_09490 [Candidatus Delongbacteria bacterium]|nr:hypothetical protein [Candidatus Delongbacteria bacterium]